MIADRRDDIIPHGGERPNEPLDGFERRVAIIADARRFEPDSALPLDRPAVQGVVADCPGSRLARQGCGGAGQRDRFFLSEVDHGGERWGGLPFDG